MAKTGIIISDKYMLHDTGMGHPESPNRIKVIDDTLRKLGFYDTAEIKVYEPIIALITDVELVHPSRYIQRIRDLSEKGGGAIGLDTIYSKNTYRTALLAVGGVLKAADLILSGEIENAFAFIRPPGHHAGVESATGFCFFNNIAILAKYLKVRKNIDKILIVDVDVHHGNGTQEIFYRSPYVTYIGLHQDGRTLYPGTGFINQIGDEEGRGHIVNVPLPPRTGDKSYLYALKEVIYPVAEKFNPDFLLVSWGFDTYSGDHLASLRLTGQAYSEITEVLLDVASKYCEKRMVNVLEGGYNLSKLGYLAANVVAKLAGLDYVYTEQAILEDEDILLYVQKLVKTLKDTLKNVWGPL